MTLHTPDQRYIIVRGRLWRAANPGLPEEKRARLVAALMDARRAVKQARAETARLNAGIVRRDGDHRGWHMPSPAAVSNQAQITHSHKIGGLKAAPWAATMTLI